VGDTTMTQDELKQQAALRALDYVIEGKIVGVGTGSTANFFIDGLATMKDRIEGAVASSEASARRLAGHGIRLLDMNEVESLPLHRRCRRNRCIPGHDQGWRRRPDPGKDRCGGRAHFRMHLRRKQEGGTARPLSSSDRGDPHGPRPGLT
jgi:hypothetical protein